MSPLPAGPLTPNQVFHLLKLVPPSTTKPVAQDMFGKELLAHLSKTASQTLTTQANSAQIVLSGATRPQIYVPLLADPTNSAMLKNATAKGNAKHSSSGKNKGRKGPGNAG